MMLIDSVKKILLSGNFIHICLNNDERHFTSCFSKMEFLTAYKYFNKFLNDMKIQNFYVSTPSALYRGKDAEFKEYVENKSIMFRTHSINEIEASLLAEYKGFKKAEGKWIKSMSISVFDSSNTEEMENFGNKRNIVFTGFNTELEILLNCMAAADNGFVPIVISDCISSQSERTHFNSLECISKIAYVIDSRDIESMTGVRI
ncbi:isochorismatase family protein [Cuniculiplasma sp. SKW4]|uniref:isochorismatase family protein n=1 Tax=Cuniculiplasma sp. SKW4 TaxID=3400171 RepID=UPI003FD1EC56